MRVGVLIGAVVLVCAMAFLVTGVLSSDSREQITGHGSPAERAAATVESLDERSPSVQSSRGSPPSKPVRKTNASVGDQAVDRDIDVAALLSDRDRREHEDAVPYKVRMDLLNVFEDFFVETDMPASRQRALLEVVADVQENHAIAMQEHDDQLGLREIEEALAENLAVRLRRLLTPEEMKFLYTQFGDMLTFVALVGGGQPVAMNDYP